MNEPDETYRWKVSAGRRLASKDEEYDWEQLQEVIQIPSVWDRMNRLNQLIEASREVDGHVSDVLLGARPYVLFGMLPPRDTNDPV